MDRLSYRQLQAFAKVMKLPGNMKYQVLWELVQARRSGNERLVSQLIAEQNRIRVNRRLNRKVAKIQAEALERLIRQEENNNAASPYNRNHVNNLSTQPEETPQIMDLETKYCVASLLDAQQRYDVMMNEARFCRNTALGLPTPSPPLFNQFSEYQCPPPSCSSTAPISSYANTVNLHTFPELGNPDDNIGHVEVIATEFRAKPPQFRPNESKKPSFQIDDLISSTPSLSYGPDSTNNYQTGYSSYAEGTPKRMRMGSRDEVSVPTVNIAQETLGSWRNYYTDLVSEPRSASSNGSHSSLFIDTNRLSPLSSETLSANELCDDPTMTNEFDSTIETSIEEVSLQPSYQTLASNFLTTLENQVLNDVDSAGQHSHVVEEITYQETEPSHNYATVVFQKPDPLDLKHTVDELSNEDTEKIFDGLKHLQKSLGIQITTDSLGPSLEVQTECDSSNMEEEKSVTILEETVIEKTSSPDSVYVRPTIAN